ncbi:MAG: cyclic nucleotide-binding domain-containing protein [Syntrophobacteraceae bacterium]|jgi:CRP-like cAMP-binding protein
MEKTDEKERLVREYLDQGNREAAVKLLFELVVLYARAKNFEAAEAARSRIFDIDSMALSEIAGSGDIIEEEKYETIDRAHLDIWARLYRDLSVVEANALYFALKKAVCQTGETISRQGEFKPRLYFIDSGRIKIVYFKDGKEVLLKNVETGQLAGEDTFFFTTLCTTSIVALCRTELRYLDSDILKVWTTVAPLLESKLQSFASKTENIAELLKTKAADRRRFRRIPLAGKAAAHLMNLSDNQVGKPFKVNMGDISRGGTSFYVRIPKRETADLLLGKRIRISCLPPQLSPSHMIEQNGTIVALRFNPFEDCTISVKFDSLLPEALIEQLERIPPPPQDFD